MTMKLCILGRQPELGVAELEAMYGAQNVVMLGSQCARIDADVDFSRLGGSVKMAELLTEAPVDTLRAACKRASSLIPKLVNTIPDGSKIKLGISTYGFSTSAFALNGEALWLKRSIRALKRSVRVVPSEGTALSSAQTYHNHLTGDAGIELVFIKHGKSTYIGRVVAVQDINAYRIRDRERPKRDAFVGMLPPKLAQIIINLASANDDTATVLDPFCGTGVILQEALLNGYRAYGTDLSPKMIEYSTTNLQWLTKNTSVKHPKALLEVANATSHTWTMPSSLCIATETYLGQPLGGQRPTPEKLLAIITDTNEIIRGFMENISPQVAPGTRLCLAIPAWFVDNDVFRLPLLEDLTSFGMHAVSFENTPAPLIYHRDEQTTGRELLVLEKI